VHDPTEGMKVAKAKGRLRGKQPKLSPMQEAHLVALSRAGEHTVSELEELFSARRADRPPAARTTSASPTSAGSPATAPSSPDPGAARSPSRPNSGASSPPWHHERIPPAAAGAMPLFPGNSHGRTGQPAIRRRLARLDAPASLESIPSSAG
jgi:hypothetical protein